jgi:hypothetical protein
MKAGSVVAIIAALLCWSGTAFAHHSFAMFDMAKKVTLKGVVKEFQWTNPHAWLEIDVPNDAGGVDMWGVEFNSPNNLTRQGWKRTMMKPGDKVTITVSPLRDGRKGGLFYEIVLADGTLMQDPLAKAGLSATQINSGPGSASTQTLPATKPAQ